MTLQPMKAYIGTTQDLQKGGWIYEPKIDGYRALCFVNHTLQFISRNFIDMTSDYPELQFRKNIKAKSCVLDGEIVAYDKNGLPNFSLLQRGNPAHFIVFDILMKNGKSLINKSLLERKKILQETVKDGNRIEKIIFTQNGTLLWKEAQKIGLEGVMAKNAESIYYSGKRSSAWLKIKKHNNIDCVIIGYTTQKRTVASPALGLYDSNKQLQYISKVGTGFSYEFLEKLYQRLHKLETDTIPVVNTKDAPKNIIWIKPKLVAEIKFVEFTQAQRLRSPVFIRLRPDKKPFECTIKAQLPIH